MTQPKMPQKKVVVRIKRKPHPHALIDSLMLDYSRDLRALWRDAARRVMFSFANKRGFNEVKKAIGDGDDLYGPPTPTEMGDMDKLIHELTAAASSDLSIEHNAQVFAFGVALAGTAHGSEDPYSLPSPTRDEIEALAASPRILDSRAMAFVSAYSFASITSKEESTWANLQTRLLESLERREHPSAAARALSQDLDDDEAGWMRIVRTESARALAAGSIDEARRLGVAHVYVPDNGQACDDCHRLIVGRVFRLEDIANKSNYRRKRANWIAAVPLHPNCTDTTIPASQWLVDQAMEKGGGSIPPEGVKVAWVSPGKRG